MTASHERKALEWAQLRQPPPDEGTPEEIEWAKKRAIQATIILLIPFFLALVIGVAIRLDRTWKASDVIAKVAETVEIKVKEGAQTEDIVEQVIGYFDSRMPDGETLDYLPDLVRILAGQKHDPSVRDNFRKTTFFTLVKTNTLVTAAMQAVLVFFFPALFVSMFFYAAKRVSRDSPQVSQGFRLLADVVWYRRRRRFLWEQGQPFFWRRFGFGLLIALASGYLFAPA